MKYSNGFQFTTKIGGDSFKCAFLRGLFKLEGPGPLLCSTVWRLRWGYVLYMLPRVKLEQG